MNASDIAMQLPDMPPPWSDKTANMLIDCATTGEPVFVFRAKDLLSTMVLTHYVGLLSLYLAPDDEIVPMVHDDLDKFRNWQKANPSLVRLPD